MKLTIDSITKRIEELQKEGGALPSVEASPGVALIAAEREREISVEGYDPEHDKGHRYGDLAAAAICYAYDAMRFDARIFIKELRPNSGEAPQAWPWGEEYWKPKDPIRDLERAGALIAAELDRRGAKPAAGGTNPLSLELIAAYSVIGAMFNEYENNWGEDCPPARCMIAVALIAWKRALDTGVVGDGEGEPFYDDFALICDKCGRFYDSRKGPCPDCASSLRSSVPAGKEDG